VGTVFGNGGELIGCQYHHGVALEAHPFLVFPDAQLLVDAFAGPQKPREDVMNRNVVTLALTAAAAIAFSTTGYTQDQNRWKAAAAGIALASIPATAAVRSDAPQHAIVAYDSCPKYEGYPDCHPDDSSHSGRAFRTRA
jgi:hypothetical protein